MPQADRPPSSGRLRFAAPLLALAALLALVVGLAWLAGLRWQSGEVYPRYSSFRADPRGTRALHDALTRLDTLHVERNVTPWERLELEAQDTILILGANQWRLSAARPNIQRWTEAGARVVVVLLTAPADERSRRLAEDASGFWPEESDDEDEAVRSESAGNEAEEASEMDEDASSLREILRYIPPRPLFGVRAMPGPNLEAQSPPPVNVSAEWRDIPLPPWRGSHVFQINPDSHHASEWRVLASLGNGGVAESSGERDNELGDESQSYIHGAPVVLARAVGEGELWLVADAYAFTNEGAWLDPAPQFLSALIGPSSRVLIDEVHLGTSVSPGVVALIRRFHLHGLLVAGILFFCLLVWQGLLPLTPIDRDTDLGEDAAGRVAGRDSSEALISLLRRSVPADRLLPEAWARWTRSGATCRHGAPLERAAEIAASARPGALAQAYRTITQLLHERKPS